MTHTPGPWEAVNDEIVARNSDSNVADVRLWDGIHPTEWQANMRLIAAAPDLLYALKALLADITDYQRINNLGGENNRSQVLARIAIAKAEAE